MSNKPASRWLQVPKSNPRAALRLFCLPYAGGSPIVFRDWPAFLPASIEVSALQLPGRGTRLQEAPFIRMEPLVEAAAQALLGFLDRPYALFGHSLGALTAFELARQFRKLNAPLPLVLFVSASRAPQLPRTDASTYNLPEPEFLAKLRRLNGTPEAILANAELMQLLLPALRADFTVLDTYTYNHQPPLGCPITVFGGEADTIGEAELVAWRVQTTAEFKLHILPGDHFFLSSQHVRLLAEIASALQPVDG